MNNNVTNIFGWLGRFADERLDPDDSNKKLAIKYAKDCGLDVNDDNALMELASTVGDKSLELMKIRATEPDREDISKITSMYEEYTNIYNGLNSIIFTRMEDEYADNDAKEFN